ncbi:MAG: Fur family transcriptional regulator [Pseudomonadota bacterium]
MVKQTQKKVPLSEKMKNFEEACKKANLKITHQRMEIFRELAESNEHPSAETIYKGLQKKLPTISLDTIYRTLATLEKQRLIIRVHTLESQARFEIESGKHHHLICSSCGKITDFLWETFDSSDLPADVQKWGAINNRNATLHGICSACAEK